MRVPRTYDKGTTLLYRERLRHPVDAFVKGKGLDALTLEPNKKFNPHTKAVKQLGKFMPSQVNPLTPSFKVQNCRHLPCHWELTTGPCT